MRVAQDGNLRTERGFYPKESDSRQRLCRLMCGSALRFRPCSRWVLGLRPNKLGVAQNRVDSFAGRPKAFRTSTGIAGEFLCKAERNKTLVFANIQCKNSHHSRNTPYA